MTIKTRKDGIKDALIALGWEEDRFGHLQTVGPNGTKFRCKLQSISIRVEKKAESQWFMMVGAYYKDVVLYPDGKVKVGKLCLGPLKRS
jgi:hypothetical protein